MRAKWSISDQEPHVGLLLSLGGLAFLGLLDVLALSAAAFRHRSLLRVSRGACDFRNTLTCRECGSYTQPTRLSARRVTAALALYFAMSLRALRGRTLMTFRAGFALKICSCLVNGLMPFRLGVAGL